MVWCGSFFVACENTNERERGTSHGDMILYLRHVHVNVWNTDVLVAFDSFF